MTGPVVILVDANVLIPRTLRDYVVYLGKAGAFELRWSQTILDETSRNLVAGFGFSPEDARELELRLVEYLPWALIEPSSRDRRTAKTVAMDPKDRHVLAAALTASASAIVTDNDRHFPREWMAHHDMDLLRTGDLLSRAATQDPDALRWAHQVTVANSLKTEAAILRTLEKAIGAVAAAAVRGALSGE